MKRRANAPGNPFGRMLQDIRVARGWTQKDMAGVLQISAPSVSLLETGHVQPRDKTVQKYLTRLSEYDRTHGIPSLETSDGSVPLRSRWYTVPLYPQKLFCGCCKRTGTLTAREILERGLGYPRYCPWCGTRLFPPIKVQEVVR